MLVGNIEVERERWQMTRTDVAQMLGVAVETYDQWILGEADIPCSAIAMLARLWGVSSDYLLGLTDYR